VARKLAGGAAALPRLPDDGRAAAWRDLDRDFVVAGFAASAAVEKPVFAQPDIQLALAEDAILLALAALFNLLALAAANFDFSGCHEGTLAPVRETENVPLVTKSFELRAMSYEP